MQRIIKSELQDLEDDSLLHCAQQTAKNDSPPGQGVEVHFDLLAGTQHSYSGKETVLGHHNFFVADHITVSCEEDLKQT